ncbi:BON domain-containing protein [Pusillimonas sp.]|uniref:BON domain-containing protein n=1 Tax=Pusillimonas sp. TaxID=3040095 RepID=UPI0037C9B756
MRNKDQRWIARTSSRENEDRPYDLFSRDTGRVEASRYAPQRGDAATNAWQRDWRQPRHRRDEQAGPESRAYGRLDSWEDDAHSGVHALEPGQRLHSRSADPGQSSYGGFTNEDPRFQGQQFHRRVTSDEYPVPTQGDGMQGRWLYADASEGYRERRIVPKGYKRSDERILEDVCERLSHSGLDVSDVSVNVEQGTVSLEGSVAGRWMKHAVEDCVDDCLGVEDIENRIRVTRRDAADPSKNE